jgi:hypothetical protein
MSLAMWSRIELSLLCALKIVSLHLHFLTVSFENLTVGSLNAWLHEDIILLSIEAGILQSITMRVWVRQGGSIRCGQTLLLSAHC